MILRFLAWLLDGPVRKRLEGARQRRDPIGVWMHSSALDTTPMNVFGDEDRRLVESPDEANLISSKLPDGKHVAILDIDLPCRLVPSSTRGKFHLFIQHPMSWARYEAVLNALAAAGIVHRKYVQHSHDRGFSNVRPAWVEKPKGQDPHFGSGEGDDEVIDFLSMGSF